MSEDERDEGGRFRKGKSGNRRGRPPKRRIDPRLPAARRDAVMRIADRMVDVRVDGSGMPERMSLYEANILQLGIAGAKGSRIAAQKFVEMAMATSERDMLMRVQNRILVERMNQVEEELYQLQKRTGSRTGVLEVPGPLEDWGRRYDEMPPGELVDQARKGALPGLGGKG